MKKWILFCICCLLLLAGCQGMDGNEIPLNMQTSAVELTEYSYQGLSFQLDSSFTTEDDLIYVDEEKNISYMPILVVEKASVSYRELLESLLSEVRQDHDLKNYAFYSATQDTEPLELPLENGGICQYDILMMTYHDGRITAVLATEISGEFITCYASFYEEKQMNEVIEAVKKIAQTFQVDKDKVPSDEAMEAENNIVANTAWNSTSDGSYFVFEDGTHFVWYRTKDKDDDSYFSGTYLFYMGESAMEHLTVDLKEYGVTREEMEAVIERNEAYRLDNLVCMSVINHSFMLDGEEQLTEDQPISYFGFLLQDGTYLDIANMVTGTYYGFTRE